MPRFLLVAIGIISSLVLTPHYSWTYLFVFALALCSTSPSRKSLLFFTTIAAAQYLAMQWLGDFIGTMSFAMPKVDHSIGWSAYRGYSRQKDFVAFISGILSCVLIGGIISQFFKGTQLLPEAEKAATSPRRWWIFVAIVALLLFFPDFEAANKEIQQGAGNLAWDFMNVFSWKFFYEHGLLPMKDFFYPYAGQNILVGPFFENQLILFAHRLGYLALLSFGSWSLFRGSWVKFGLFSLLGIYLFEQGSFGSADRYLNSFSCLVFFLALLRGQFRHWAIALWGSLAIGWTFFLEPHQAGYMFLGATAAMLAALIGPKATSRKNLLLPFAMLFGGGLLCLVVIVFWTSTGQIEGLLEILSLTTEFRDSAGVETNVSILIKTFNAMGGLFFQILFLFSAFFTACFVAKKPSFRAVMLIGFVAFLTPILCKHIIRPHMASQITGIYVLSIALVILSGVFRAKWQQSFACLIVGFLIGQAQNEGSWRKSTGFLWRRGEVAFQSIKSLGLYLSTKPDEQRKIYYNPTNFRIGNLNGSQWILELNRLLPDWESKKFFVLGDTNIFYALFGKSPPYTSTFYEGTALTYQLKNLDWFIHESPDFIIWNHSSTSQDEVPFLIRNPLIHQQVINNYRHIGNIDNFSILVPRGTKPIDITFWKNYLGDSLDFGHIRGNGSFSEHTKPCSQASGCLAYLEIKWPASTPPGTKKIDVGIGHDRFSFRIHVAGPGISLFPLDRLWFWQVGKREGLEITIKPEDLCELKIVDREANQPFLF